jgi:DNA-binding NtrC family response regulator
MGVRLMKERLSWVDLAHLDVDGANVLIVDDDPAIRRTLEKVVSEYGYRTTIASSAEEADQWLSATRFDVVLLDIELPRMNGVEFLTWALARDPELAVIMLTGLDNPDIALECLSKGARTYFVKPFDSAFIRHALRDAVAMRQLLVDRNEHAG